MTKLDCNVTSCIHNAENCCCKSAIVVEGERASDKCDTCCGSFDENKDSAFHNLFKTPESRLEIDCEEVNFKYNENRHCSAEKIGISGGKAKDASGTECATFAAK